MGGVRFITGQGQAGAQGFYGGGEDGGVKDGGEENGVKEELTSSLVVLSTEECSIVLVVLVISHY